MGWKPDQIPIRVLPLPGESLDSWIEAYARRLRTTSRGFLHFAGIPKHGRTRSDHTICLHPAEADHLARITGIEISHLHAMTLRRFDGRAVTVDQDNRTIRPSPRWGRVAGTRYCPPCLAQRNGRWSLAWRLSWVFACTEHNLILNDRCPTCEQIPRRSVGAGAGSHPAASCRATPAAPRRRSRCGADLTDAPASPLTADDPLILAQQRINTLLAAGPTGTGAFDDLHAVASWLLRHSTAHDFHPFGADAVRAWHDLAAAAADKGRTPGQHPPADATLMGAVTTRAIEITDGEEHHVIGHLRDLLNRSPHHKMVRPPGLGHQQWQRLSIPVQSRFLRAMDPGLLQIDRIRYRSTTPQARQPDTDDTTQRSRSRRIPQLLWPEWTVRLMPAQGFRSERFRAGISTCLLLPGHPDRRTKHITTGTGLEPRHKLTIAAFLRDLAENGHDSVFSAICQLADYLDTAEAPIDYARRRATIPTETISTHHWKNISYQAGVHPGEARRHRDAQRHLYQMLTGADLNNSRHTLAFTSGQDRANYYAFTESLSLPLRDALSRHATSLLHEHGIDEPLTWQPPPECCTNLDLPGTDPGDIDLEAVHQLAVLDRMPVGAIGEKLNTSIDHVRLALERIPQPAGRFDWGRRAQARARFTRSFFEREYVHGGKRLRQIAAETGYNRKFLAECARDAGIPLAVARQTTPIDEAWLREQYLNRKRSFPDIATGLDVSEMTVIRAAHRYGIPTRPADGTSHPDMIKTLDKSLPRDIRRAVEGSRHGWQRLHRFEITMGLPTIEQAAAHLGADQAALVRQLQRLENDIGAQLFHRSTPTKSMRPTRRGTSLLQKLTHPDIRYLTQQSTPPHEQRHR